MDDPDGYFGERVAASYDDPADRMNQPEAIEPAISFLAALAGDGPDLMARLAGLRLRGRWAGWNREPFTSASGSHVSVWEKPSS